MWGNCYKKVLILTITGLFMMTSASNIKKDADLKQNSVFDRHIFYKKNLLVII